MQQIGYLGMMNPRKLLIVCNVQLADFLVVKNLRKCLFLMSHFSFRLIYIYIMYNN